MASREFDQHSSEAAGVRFNADPQHPVGSMLPFAEHIAEGQHHSSLERVGLANLVSRQCQRVSLLLRWFVLEGHPQLGPVRLDFSLADLQILLDDLSNAQIAK